MERFQQITRALHALAPDPLPRHIIARLTGGEASPFRQDLLSGTDLLSQPQIARLVATQRPDGSWGRFHSMDSARRQFPATTEQAVRLALFLGMSLTDEPIQRAHTYLEKLLAGEIEMRDPPEENERWATGKELFAASTLALIDPKHPRLDAPIQRWGQVLGETFREGIYLHQYEADAQREIHAIYGKLYYLHINNRYTIELLGARPGLLDPSLREAYCAWLAANPNGIGYLGGPIAAFIAKGRFGDPSRRELSSFLDSASLITRLEATCMDPHGIFAWLGEQQGQDGLWDFGKARLARISNSWRKAKDRIIDHTLHVLQVMACTSRFDLQ